MIRIWIIYNLLLTILIFGLSLNKASSLTNYLLPFLLVPLLYYLSKELFKKPRKTKLKESTVFASDVIKSTTTPVLEGEVVPEGISDDNRRLFLKLVGSTSLSIFFLAVLGKGSAKAAFFGSMPGPGTVAIKNSAGDQIDPAEAQPTDGYTITQVDDSSTPSYYGFVHKTGAWYITKEDNSGNYRYAKGASAFSTSWTGRAGLSYDYFDNVF